MARVRADLSGGEAQVLRELVLGSQEHEVRLVAMLRDARLVQALRTDTGPLLEIPRDRRVGHPRELRGLDDAKGVHRIVTVELDRAGAEFQERLWECVLEGSVRAEPPWIPVVDLVQRLPAGLRRRLGWFLRDGAYAVTLDPDPLAVIPAHVVICAPGSRQKGLFVRSGRARHLPNDPRSYLQAHPVSP